MTRALRFLHVLAGAPGADPRLRVRASRLARANVVVVLLVVVLGLALRG